MFRDGGMAAYCLVPGRDIYILKYSGTRNGTGVFRDGGMAAYCLVPGRNIYPGRSIVQRRSVRIIYYTYTAEKGVRWHTV